MSNIKKYSGSAWQPVEIDADMLGGKASSSFQDKLISGTNIKTINGSNILGSGNITISASVPTASSTTLGGIKLGHANVGMVPVEYPVELDSENKAYVSVPIYGYYGTTYGDCYAIDSPNDDYSMQIGSSGFTVDVGDTVRADSNLLQVSSDKFQYRQSDVMTGATKYLQSAYFKHWHGMFVCPSNTYYYRLIAKATNSGSNTNLYQTITVKGTIGGWGSSEQCEFMYVVALRSDNFSTANNIRKTIFRGSTYTTESAIASNTGLDIVTHRNSSTGELYIYLRSYGAQKYSQYNIIVTANGWGDIVELPTDENFYTSSSGTLVSGSQLLSATQNQCIEITNKNLRTINGYSLMGDTDLTIGLQMTNSYSGNVCFHARPSWDTTMTQIYSSFSSYTPYIVLPYQMPWFYLTWGTTDEWPSMCFLERTGTYTFHFRFYRNGSPMEYQNVDVRSQVVRFGSCKIFKLI